MNDRDRSGMHGTATSAPEVTRISRPSLWVLVDERELFLSFEEFPWFRGAPVEDVFRVERSAPDHLRWPALDVDLSVESIEHPERFPLKSNFRGDEGATG